MPGSSPSRGFGIDDFLPARLCTMAGLDIPLRLVLPILLGAGLFIYAVSGAGAALYHCSWLLPHFSAVETINGLMRARQRTAQHLGQPADAGEAARRFVAAANARGGSTVNFAVSFAALGRWCCSPPAAAGGGCMAT